MPKSAVLFFMSAPLSWSRPDCLIAKAFYGPMRCHQNAHLFVFTPPDAAVRFADGTRKSFSIATCLGDGLETKRWKTCPAVSKNDRPFSVVNGAPTNTGSRIFKTARESGPIEQNGDFSGLQFQRAARTKFTNKANRVLAQRFGGNSGLASKSTR